jgi:hypothetical protein
MNRGALLLAALLAAPAARGEVRSPIPTPASCAEAALDFEENLGQADPAVRFLARGSGFLALFTDDAAVFACGRDASIVRMGFPGGGAFAAGDRRPGVSNYPPRVSGARRFGEILRRDVWPGIDLRWEGGLKRSLSYSFHVAAGADPGRVTLDFCGAEARVAPSGDLLVSTAGGVLRHGRPRAFQGDVQVPVAFFPRPDGTVGFALGDHDASRPLVIDPAVVFTANHGGSAEDEAWAVAADPLGNLYFAGWAVSTNLPVTNGTYQMTSGGAYDAFVVKRAPRGSFLLYATYLGGTGADLAYALAVDDAGSAFVAGGTQSADFPVQSALQPVRGTVAETGFVAKLTPTGAALSFSTYLGGSVSEAVRAIRLGPLGEVYVAGTTSSADFPHPGAAQPALSGSTDAFVAKMAPGGGSLVFSTFLGGTLQDEGRGLAVGADGTVFVAGMTESIDFPDVNALKAVLSGSRDAFLAALAPDGSAFAFATYLGGSALEEAWGLALDPAGAPWVVGYTTSPDFPLVSPVDNSYGGQFEAFATRYAADGSAVQRSTFLGGSGSDKAEAVGTDGAGVVYVVGRTSSADFPTKDAVDDTYNGGDYDAFVAALTPSGTQMLWCTYRGGSGTDFAMACAVDFYNSVVLAGRIEGTNGDGLLTAVIAVPLPPASLTATLTGLARVKLTWPDQGPDEQGYVVQRRTGNGPWSDVKTTIANVLQYTDVFLTYSTTYTWRVFAFNEYGRSAPSMEATVTTLPDPVAPPAAPTDLQVTYYDTRQVSLAWTDNSADEDVFVLERFDPYVGFFIRATLDRNVKTFLDDSVLPLRTIRYRVRAVNPRGSSLPTPEVVLTLDASFGMEILAGRRRTKDGERKDLLQLTGTVARENDTRWGVFDPSRVSFEVRLGDDPNYLVLLPPDYAGWKRNRKGLWILKYPFSGRGKLTIVIDPQANTFKFTLAKADLLPLAAGPEEVRLLFGEDGANFFVDWTPQRRAGDYRFP